MSAWLQRLQNLVSSPHLGSEISKISETTHCGDNGDFGTQVEAGKEGVRRWHELPPLPIGDAHDRWLRGEPEPVAWTEREDVRLVVEDLHRERWHPRRIARELGLRVHEVQTILGRRGR